MVDIFSKPTIQQVEELRGYLGDPFLYYLTKGIIRRLNENKVTDCISTWKCLTRQMFLNYSANEVYGMVEKCLEEASDKQWLEHKYPRGCWNEDWKYNPKKKRSVIKLNLKKSRIRKLINDNIKITDVAKSYGLKVKNKMAICPFHTDTQMSLSFSDEKNIFHCFGCHAKGNIIEFVRKLEKEEAKNERGNN